MLRDDEETPAHPRTKRARPRNHGVNASTGSHCADPAATPSRRAKIRDLRNRRHPAGVLDGPAEHPPSSVAAPEIDLPACIARVLAGDPEAARTLVQRCHPLVRRLVRAHRPRSVAADDLAQDVFAKMFTHLQHYEPRGALPFEHWLARIAVNTCRDALRGEARRASSIPITDAAAQWLEVLSADPAPAAHDALAARELVDALLAELPPDDRLVLTLLDLEERSVAEIAALTGWSRSLVKVRAFRARIRLRAIARRRAGDVRG